MVRELFATVGVVVSRSAIGFILGIELLLYLALGVSDEQEVTGEWLQALEDGHGEGELRTHLWWDQAWCSRIMRQHEKRKRLREAWH